MIIVTLIINIVVVAIDQITKYLAVQHLKPIGSVTLIDGIFSLTFAENTGAAFGLFKGGRWFFVGITIVMLIGIYIYYIRLPKTKEYNKLKVALSLISAGAIGNFIDRFRAGVVIDFFHATFIDFPIFNIADCSIVIGTILMGILVIFFIKE